MTMSARPPPDAAAKGGATAWTLRRSVGLRPRGPPHLANGRAIETLGLEQPGGRRQMLLALPNPAAPARARSRRISWTRWSNGASSSHFSRYPNASSSETLRDEMLQQGSVAGAESTPLSDQPTVEGRAAVDLQAVEKVTVEQGGQRAQPLRGQGRNALLGRPGDLDHIDGAIRQIEPDGVAAGINASPARLVDDAPDLAEAPAQLAPRIVGDVPQQLAKLAARDGARGKRQIGDQRTHLA